VDVLGIGVSDAQVRRWIGWFAPREQPFRVPSTVAATLGIADGRDRLSMELRDTFELYGVGDDVVGWLDRAAAGRLPTELRRSQPARHVWPDQILGREVEAVCRFVARRRRPSRHRDVPAPVWRASRAVLPGASRVAGTFPRCSGPNCFGAVMAVAGETGAEQIWMQVEPFERWLGERAAPGGDDSQPGTLLVWRRADGSAVHAAITLGGGWALHKPSQGWMSPTKVLRVHDIIRSSRYPGQRLHRYRLDPPTVR